jgi:hypothetical protein
MTDATQIHPDKLRAFHNTSYRLGQAERYAIPQLILLR